MSARRAPTWWRRLGRSSASASLAHDRVARALVVAAARRDAGGVRRLIASTAVLTVDSGGRAPAPTPVLSGGDEVTAYLIGAFFDPAVQLVVETVNGLPGIVVRDRGTVAGVLVIAVRFGTVQQGWLVTNPDKLRHWNTR